MSLLTTLWVLPAKILSAHRAVRAIPQVWRPELGMIRDQPEGVKAARLQLTSVRGRSMYALFASGTEAWLNSGDMIDRVKRAVGLSRSSPGLRLRRGWEEPESEKGGGKGVSYER